MLFTTAGVGGTALLPVIGTSVERPDSKTAVVKIYDYVRDSGGNAITAADVVFSYETQKQKATQTDTAFIESVSADDSYTFRMVLNTDNAGTMDKLLTHIPVVARVAYQANPDVPATTAPYKVTNAVHGSSYRVERVANYWQKDELNQPAFAHNVEVIVFKCIPESSQTAISLETGAIQMAISMNGQEAARFQAGGSSAKGFAVDSFPSNFTNTLLLNDTASSPCHDINLRKAILYAVNRENIIRLILHGSGKVAKDLASSILQGYNSEWLNEDYYSYSLDKAKEALAKSSYRGQTLKLQGVTGDGVLLELIQAQLEAVGIKSAINTYENALWQEHKVGGIGDYDIQTDGLGGSLVTAAWKVKFDPNNFSTRLPQTGSTDPKIISLLSAATDAATHGPKTIEEFHDYIVDNAYAIGLYSPATLCVTADSIKDIFYSYQGYVCPGACTYTASYSYKD
jgi:ABC-type transport system substrate-binding protein